MRTLLLLFLLCVIPVSAQTDSAVLGDQNSYISASISRARALAMGSAYHSLVDDFSSGLYNPGAFRLNSTREENNFRLFFNPVGMGVAMYDYSKYNRDFERDDKLTLSEGLFAASMILKGAVYTTPLFDFGFNLGEEIISDSTFFKQQNRFFSAEKFVYSSFNSAYVNFKIASAVSLGLSGTLYNSRTDGNTLKKGGYTFGVLLKPNPKLNVGIVYHEIPEEFSSARFPIESIENETVTSGVSYYPDEKTVFSIDLRNLNKEDKFASREIHTGVERCIGKRLAVRAGYYRKKQTQNDVYSFGIGILPFWGKISKYVNSSRNDIFSYSFIIEENGTRRWHVFSLLLRL
ncbi:hypothetical protein ACFL6H_05975 [Candidatus Latescibacterota bacterium]